MSEILTEAPSVETGFGFNESKVFAVENIEERKAELDRILTPIVSANADVIVKCPWLGGAEVALSDAMRAYPRPMIEEDPYVLASVVMELLSRPPEEDEQAEPTEDGEETVEPEVEEPAKDRQDKVLKDEPPAQKKEAEPKNGNKAKVQKEPTSPRQPTVAQPETRTAETERVSINEETAPKIDKPMATVDEVRPVSDNSQKQPEQPAGIAAEPAAEPARPVDSVTPLRKDGTGINERLSVTVSTPEGPAPRGISDEISPTLDISQPAVAQETKADGLLITAEETTENKEPLSTGIKSAIKTDDGVELVEEELEITPLETKIIPIIEYEADTGSPIDLLEKEFRIYHPEEAVFEAEEQRFDDLPESNIIEDSPLTIEEVEESLIMLSEHIDIAEPEAKEIVNVILGKISEISTKLEADNNGVSEAEVQAELEESFIELFDSLGIDYTPELIESLARLTIKLHLAEKIAELEAEEEPVQVSQHNGTHEFIKRLLVRSNTIQKAMLQAGAIGKSVLLLYNNSFLVDQLLTKRH